MLMGSCGAGRASSGHGLTCQGFPLHTQQLTSPEQQQPHQPLPPQALQLQPSQTLAPPQQQEMPETKASSPQPSPFAKPFAQAGSTEAPIQVLATSHRFRLMPVLALALSCAECLVSAADLYLHHAAQIRGRCLHLYPTGA